MSSRNLGAVAALGLSFVFASGCAEPPDISSFATTPREVTTSAEIGGEDVALPAADLGSGGSEDVPAGGGDVAQAPDLAAPEDDAGAGTDTESGRDAIQTSDLGPAPDTASGGSSEVTPSLTFTVTYDNAGGAGCGTMVVTFGATYGAAVGGALCVPVRIGFTFSGWYLGSAPITASTVVTTALEHTLTARWSANAIAVTFDSEGGSACQPIIVTPGRPYAESAPGGALCAPTRTGQSFGGWHDGDNGSGNRILGTTIVTNPLGHTLHARWVSLARPGFARVPTGTFTIGAPQGELGRGEREAPSEVTLTRDFELGLTEVTQGAWRAVSGGVNPSCYQLPDAWHCWNPCDDQPFSESGCTPEPSATGANDQAPVETVSWWSALGYANARSVADGLPPCYLLPAARPDGTPCRGTWQAGDLDCGDQWPATAGQTVEDCVGYRLPTEAEWEYAARGGTATATPSGDLENAGCNDVNLARVAWYCNNSDYHTQPVGRRAPNAWGLQDMLGNVAEWVWDGLDASAAGAPGGRDPKVELAGGTRVVRGGHCNEYARATRSASRAGVDPGLGQNVLGFRLARTASDFVAVAPGRFTIGSPTYEPGRVSNNEHQLPVTLTRPFEISETEVTQARWKAFSGGVNPACWQRPDTRECTGDNANDDAPVENLTWWSALAYANAVSVARGLPACYTLPETGCTGSWERGDLNCPASALAVEGGNVYACAGYRLPTEAEWEYAARAGTNGSTWLGDLSSGVDTSDCLAEHENLDPIGWWCGNSGYHSHPVRSLGPNPWGLFDMLGNVAEFVWDGFVIGGAAGGTDPQRASGARRGHRGGSAFQGAGEARAANRDGLLDPSMRMKFIGFRLVRTLGRP